MKMYMLFTFAITLISIQLSFANAFPISHDNCTFDLGRKITLPAGTLILMELAEQIESDRMTIGQLVKFKVTTDVVVDGKMAIRTGAFAYGRVKSISPSTYNNTEEINLEVTSVQSVDGQQIALNGAEQIIKGQYSGQGSSAKLGTTITATVMNDVEIKTN